MSMASLTNVMSCAGDGTCSIPAFNILNHLTIAAVIEECEAARSPVIIQTSVATVKFYGVARLSALVRLEAERASVPVALHLDHCTEPELAKECVDNGWTSVMVDASRLPFAENVAVTRDVVEYAHARGVEVEGELGAIAGVEDHIVVADQAASLADVEQSREFVAKTGIDAFAPAIGTAHGLYKGEPKIDFERFKEIRAACGGVPLVVHGGTGLSVEVFHRLTEMGAAKINISTALKIAYTGGARDYLEANVGKENPLKMDRFILDRVRKTVRDHIDIFRSAGRA